MNGFTTAASVWPATVRAAARNENRILGFSEASIMSIVGYRVGEPQKEDAVKVLAFEIYDMGNVDMLCDAADALNCRHLFWCAVVRTLLQRFHGRPKAIWLCKSRAFAKEYYGNGEEDPVKVRVPEGALVLCDLGKQGQLYAYTGDLEYLE